MNNLKKITAIIVLYSTTDIIFKCLENLKNIKIIIVDNGNNNNLPASSILYHMKCYMKCYISSAGYLLKAPKLPKP